MISDSTTIKVSALTAAVGGDFRLVLDNEQTIIFKLYSKFTFLNEEICKSQV